MNLNEALKESGKNIAVYAINYNICVEILDEIKKVYYPKDYNEERVIIFDILLFRVYVSFIMIMSALGEKEEENEIALTHFFNFIHNFYEENNFNFKDPYMEAYGFYSDILDNAKEGNYSLGLAYGIASRLVNNNERNYEIEEIMYNMVLKIQDDVYNYYAELKNKENLNE